MSALVMKEMLNQPRKSVNVKSSVVAKFPVVQVDPDADDSFTDNSRLDFT